MEELKCAICVSRFNNSTVVPKVLKCGHSFCQVCLDKLMHSSPVCPTCRKSISGAVADYGTNLSLLKVIDLIASPKLKDLYTTQRLLALKKQFTSKLQRLERAKTEINSILEKDIEKSRISLRQIQELSQEGNAEENAQEVEGAISELEGVYQGLRDRISLDFSDLGGAGAEASPDHEFSDLGGVGAEASPDHSNLEAEVSIRIDAFESPDAYVDEIRRLSMNGEQIHTIGIVGEEIRYGRITTHGQHLLIHAVDLHEKPEGSTSSVWFDDFKRCGGVNGYDPSVFMKISNRGNGREELLGIDLRDCEREGFIELCTGEGGPSYKGRKLDPIRSGGRPSLGQNVPFGEEGTGGVLGYGEGWRGEKWNPSESQFCLRNFSRGKFEIVQYRKGDNPRDLFGGVCYIRNGNFCPILPEDLLMPDWEIVDCGLFFRP